jgi:hypothetical protein
VYLENWGRARLSQFLIPPDIAGAHDYGMIQKNDLNNMQCSF